MLQSEYTLSVKTFLKHLPLFTASLTLSTVSYGQTLGWSSSASTTPLGYFSNGSPTGSALTWNVGYFANNFNPTISNHSQWFANFVIVDTALETFFDPNYAVDGFKQNVGVSAAGKPIWFFAYNDASKIGTHEGEALLFRQIGPVFPSAPNFESVDIADNPSDPADDPFEVVWGQVERKRESAGGVVIGGGFFPNQLTDTTTGSWEAQTGTWPSTSPTPYELATLAIADPNLRSEADDADGDGRSNFFEHATGSDMNSSDAGYSMVGPANPTSVTITLPAARPSDVRYTIQYNENLSNTWQELSRCVGTAAWVGATPLSITPIAPSRETILFTTPTPATRGFYRLKFERVVP